MKKNLIYLLTLVVISVSSTAVSYGQTSRTTEGPSRQAKIADAKIIKDRTLLVVLTDNPDFDQKINYVVHKYWTFNKNIVFVASDDLKKTLNGKEEKYAVLLINRVEITETRNSSPAFRNKYIRFSIKLGEKLNKRRAVYYQNVAYSDENREFKKIKLFKRDKAEHPFDLDDKEILFALDRIQNHLIARSEGKQRFYINFDARANSGKLATKTLLIARADMYKKLTEQDIRKLYPYPFKIVEQKDIEQAYLSRNKDDAFVEIAPFGSAVGIMTQYVVDCETGQLLSYGDEFNGFEPNFKNFVSKGHIRAYVRHANIGQKGITKMISKSDAKY